MDFRNVNLIAKVNTILNEMRKDLTGGTGRYKFKAENDVDFVSVMCYESSSIGMRKAFKGITGIMQKTDSRYTALAHADPGIVERWEIPQEYLNKVWLGLRRDFARYVILDVKKDGIEVIRSQLDKVEIMQNKETLFITCKVVGQYVRK